MELFVVILGLLLATNFIAWAIWDAVKCQQIQKDKSITERQRYCAKSFVLTDTHCFNWLRYARKSNFELFRLFEHEIYKA